MLFLCPFFVSQIYMFLLLNFSTRRLHVKLSLLSMCMHICLCLNETKSQNAKAALAGTAAAGDDKTQQQQNHPNRQEQHHHHHQQQQRRSSLRVMMPKLPSNDSLSGVSVGGAPSSPGDLNICLCLCFC